jgi:hypothetical protein
LSPAEDKRTFFDGRETGLRDEEYPHISFGTRRAKIIRCFPDKVPIGIDKEDTTGFVFLYLVPRRIPIDFRQFLIRHHTLFLNLHTWTVRLLVPRRFRKAVALYKAALREQLWTPLNLSVSTALETYFRGGRSAAATWASLVIGPSPRSSHAHDSSRRSPAFVKAHTPPEPN